MKPLRHVPLAALLLLGACNPLSCWHPEALPMEEPKELTSSSPDFPVEPVDVVFDDLGVPHIYGQSETDIVYALGVAHSRDRMFQIVFRKHAAQGRLMELLGEGSTTRYRWADRHQRLLTWRLDDAFANLSPRDTALLEAYAAGVNDGYAEHGNPAELDILALARGWQWEEFTAWDSLSIMRLLQDNQTGRAEETLAWDLLFKQLGREHPLLAEIPVRIDALGWPVVGEDEQAGQVWREGFTTPRTARDVGELLPAGRYEVARSTPLASAQRPLLPDVLTRTLHLDTPGGASNSWVVSGERTASGNPVLANDPHMPHDQLWYLADLQAPDWAITGVSFPGIPVIIIGHSRHAAWGLTNPNVFSEELIELQLADGRDDAYVLDGEVVELDTLEQTYLAAGKDEPVLTETWQISEFGPVLPPGRLHFLRPDPDAVYAYQWTAQHYDDAQDFISMWFDIGRAETAEEMFTAAEKHVAPPISFPFALQDGTIGYAMMGFVPERADNGPPWLPRDGSTRAAAWGERIPFAYHPQMVNPEKGWLTASNQRLVPEGGTMDWAMGPRGDTGHRGERLSEQLTLMLAAGKPTTEQLGDLQQDIYSTFAERVAPIYASLCPTSIEGQPDHLVEEMCGALRRYDFQARTTSSGALVFEWMWWELNRHVAMARFGPDLGERWHRLPYYRRAVMNALLEVEAGGAPLLFDDPKTDVYEGAAHFLRSAAGTVLRRLRDKLGDDPEAWRWGAIHQYQVKGLLAAVPQLTWLFYTDSYPQDGCSECVRAEQSTASGNNLTVNYGSALRMVVELSDPVRGRIATDLGQAEQFGHPHKEDMVPLWESGDLPIVSAGKDELGERVEGRLRVKPAP